MPQVDQDHLVKNLFDNYLTYIQKRQVPNVTISLL